ncbi:MAG TPA: dihydrodipicolinate synthase family protein [Candidatus Dormibacteraeota bacterium]|nr:dihydrodipicolinate synthase family protein [Candidatus Dormibacteraeota bacterium]
MPDVLRLPTADGGWIGYQPRGGFAYPKQAPPPRSRIPYAAVHVVADPWADTTPISPAAIDWEATLAFRHHIWSYGLGVAEAMDTAQRGMGLDWATCRELIRRTVAEARACGGRVVCGAQTDHLEPGSARTLRDIEAAYEEQCEFIEGCGAQVVLMASRELARIARRPEDYLRVYDRVLSQLQRPALIHWLGEVFDPQLRGYWGYEDLDKAMEVCLEVIRHHAHRIEGIKLSLLDQRREVEMRSRLPRSVHMFTGDDFDYPATIKGDGDRYSDALLGAFDAIAPAASAALLALDAGDEGEFERILAPTLPLARHIFSTPTFYYKTGIVFLAYLNGHQRHFKMVGGLESARSTVHLARIFLLADQAGLLQDPELAVERMRLVLRLAGADEVAHLPA